MYMAVSFTGHSSSCKSKVRRKGLEFLSGTTRLREIGPQEVRALGLRIVTAKQ
jgi:hypothetical protein